MLPLSLPQLLHRKSINTFKICMKELPEFKFSEVYWHILEHDRNTAKKMNRIHENIFMKRKKHSHYATKHVKIHGLKNLRIDDKANKIPIPRLITRISVFRIELDEYGFKLKLMTQNGTNLGQVRPVTA